MLTCNACKFPIDSVDARTQHYKSEWHRYNVKRRCAGLNGVTESLFSRKLQALQRSKGAIQQTIECKICNKTFKNASALERHEETKSHQKKVNKVSSRLTTPQLTPASSMNDDPSNLETKLEGAGPSDDAEPKTEYEPRPIPLKTCLFCRMTHTRLSSSLKHMLKKHGFFIPFAEYLDDVEGFLEYLGYKIGVGHVCIYCNGKGKACYKDVYACQSHMMDKGHCKLPAGDDEYEEFIEFYNFPEEIRSDDDDTDDLETKMGNLDIDSDEDEQEVKVEMTDNLEQIGQQTDSSDRQLVAVPKRKRHLAGINDDGELLMSDGSLIGHRQHNKIYRQNLRPAETRESVLINRLMLKYRAIELPGWGRNRSKYNERTTAIQNFINKTHLRVANNRKVNKRANNIVRHHLREQINF